MQPHTPKGHLWEWIPPNGAVQGKYLEFVDRMSGTSVGDYIVVLKFMKDQVPEESPEPLGTYASPFSHAYACELTTPVPRPR